MTGPDDYYLGLRSWNYIVRDLSRINQRDTQSMSIETAEKLKQDLTDKWVVVDKTIPELKRFANRTGKVKTVNMNGQALVEFDSSEDIGWYDIHPNYLTVVDGPQKQEKAAAAKKAAPKAAAKKAAAGGKSPLDMIRAQGAAGSGAAKKPAGGASPLDMIRKQGAAKKDGTASEASVEKPAASAGGEKKLSPIEMIRQQGAVKKGGESDTEAPAEEAPATEPAADDGAPEKPASKADSGDEKLSPLELIRKQGAAKR